MIPTFIFFSPTTLIHLKSASDRECSREKEEEGQIHYIFQRRA